MKAKIIYRYSGVIVGKMRSTSQNNRLLFSRVPFSFPSFSFSSSPLSYRQQEHNEKEVANNKLKSNKDFETYKKLLNNQYPGKF
jgi:hypothetical protein